MTTTQQHIDGLISTIWHATEDRSVTNVMVARVLDWLNRRALQLRTLIEQGETERKKDLKEVYRLIDVLSNRLKGVSTVANAAHGRADINARNIGMLTSRIDAIIDALILGGYLPSGWGNGDVYEPSISPEHVDRGTWRSGEMYYAGELNEATGLVETSHVWYMGCKYRCLTSGTSEAPKWNSPDWEFEEGDPEPHVLILGADDPLIAVGETKNIDCRVIIYNQDATDDVAEWEISRNTGSETEDTAWSLKDKAQDFDGNIELAYTGSENDLGYGDKASFLVTARLSADGPEAYGLIEF